MKHLQRARHPQCSFRVTVPRGRFRAGLVSRWSYRAPSYLTMTTTCQNVFHHFNSPQNIQKMTMKTNFWGEPQVTFLPDSSSWSKDRAEASKWQAEGLVVKTDLGSSVGSFLSSQDHWSHLSIIIRCIWTWRALSHFQRATAAGCSQAQPHLCGVLRLGSYHKSSGFLLWDSFHATFNLVDKRWCVCVGGTDRETDHGLIDPSLILSFSSIHDRFPLNGKKKVLEEICPKRL